MSTSIAFIVERAADHNVANTAAVLTNNQSEMIAKVAAFEHDIFTRIAAESRYFQLTAAGASTNASQGRTFDTATLGNVERVIWVTTDTGTVLAPVDLEDPDAEIDARYYMAGTVITEVASSWGTTGVVNLLTTYAAAPAVLDPAGSTSQTVTLPDKYCDLLSIRLAGYLALKDMEARDPAEVQTLDGLYSQRLTQVILSLELYPGEVRRRFMNPGGFTVSSA